MNGEQYTANEIIEGSPTVSLKKDGIYNQYIVFEEGLDNFLRANNIRSTVKGVQYAIYNNPNETIETLKQESLTLDEFSKELTGLEYEELKEDVSFKDNEDVDDKYVGENNYKKHFRKELEILKDGLKEGNELSIQPFIPLIEKITEVFSQQGHSGCSAAFGNSNLVETIRNVLSFKPLSGITCEDHEWNDIGGTCDGNKDIYQNKREGAVFKEGKESKPYYLDAIVWKGEEDWDTFTGTVEEISSRQFIKLPFMSKTFYIDVVKIYNPQPRVADHVDEDGREYVYEIKDRNQLKEVAEYYDTSF